MSLIDFFTKRNFPEQKSRIKVGKLVYTEFHLSKETQELVDRWKKLENEILEDDAVIAATKEAFKILESIFDGIKGNDGIVRRWQEELKRLHGEGEWLEHFLYFKLKKDQEKMQQLRNIFGNHAFNDVSHIALFKSSLLYRFLEKTGTGKDIQKLRRIVEILDKHATRPAGTRDITRSFIFENYPNLVRNAIDLFLSILERHKDYLMENKNRILQDSNYEYSIINILVHEITHQLWSKGFNHKLSHRAYNTGIDESWAHLMQLLSHMYKENIFITEELLDKEIDKIYGVLEDKSKVKLYSEKDTYGLSQHLFMQCFMPLFGALILIDSILRQNGRNINSQIRKCFRSGDVNNIYLTTLECLDALDDRKLKEMINNRLIRRFKQRKLEVELQVIKGADSYLNLLSGYRWWNVPSALQEFLSYLNVLLLIDPSNGSEVNKLRAKMEKILNHNVKTYFSQAGEEIKKMVGEEKSSIDQLIVLFENEKRMIRFLESSTPR